MKKHLAHQSHSKLILLLALFILAFSTNSLSQTSPVTVSTMLGYPTSVYLPDYYTAESNKLMANLVLNDFNEPSRDVFLKITIESQNVRISSNPNYVPASPLTLYPGEIAALSGSDFEEYLNYNNIITEGISKEELISRGGRLPEGLYTFCVEAFDMITKKSLSNNSCAITLLAQFETPTLLIPEENGVVPPTTNQNIVFQWINNATIDPSELVYKFVLYELIDPYADPKQAIGNNQALIIHEEETSAPLFTYNTSHPLLEIGKTYIYQVQCQTIDGRAFFKNDGFSEPSYFHYGYPGDGKITLLEPENNSALFLRVEKIFRWTPPDNLMSGQIYRCEIRIAKVDSLRSDEEVLADDSIHFAYTTLDRTGSMNISINADAHFPTGTDFAWQVKAYTEDQEIAKSSIQHFGGPPCILDFIAANLYINVTSTDGCSLDNISGTGNVQIDPLDNRHDVVFNNITIGKEGVQYYLQSGEVLADVSDMEPIKLTAEYDRNGDAWFYPDSIKLNRYDYYIKGHIEWAFPHAVDQEETPVIKSVTKWIRYEDFYILGPMDFMDSTNFDLLDPMNFNIEFTEGSRFYIRGTNNYTANFNGTIHLPDNVTDLNKDLLAYTFKDHNQLFNIYSNSETSYPAIQVANNTTLELKPKSFVLDLDNSDSPQLFTSNPLWKGLYISSGTYNFKGDYAFSKQFAVNEELSAVYDFDSHDSIHAYIVNNGLWAKSKIHFAENNQLFFNTFPAQIDEFSVEVERSITQKGYIDGSISIPLLDDVDDFDFTAQLNDFGFMTGYLHNNIEGRVFEYNADSEEEKLILSFGRGYFADNERLETTVTIEWPYLNTKFENLPMFRIWGNYDIGFGSPNTAYSLAQQKQTMLKGFQITIDGIGAGRQGNVYAIGTSAKMVMAEDASGDNGPPVLNFYSVSKSTKIDEEYAFGGVNNYENVNSTSNATAEGISDIGLASEGYTTIGDAQALLARYEKEVAEAEAKAMAAIPSKTTGEPVKQKSLSDELAESIPVPGGDTPTSALDPLSTLTYQDLILAIEFLAPLLDDEQRQKVEAFKELLITFSPDQIEQFIDKFSDLRGLLNDLITEQIYSQIEKQTQPIKQRVDALNETIAKSITQGTDSLLYNLDKGIEIPVNSFSEMAVGFIQKSPVENKSPYLDAVNQLSSSIITDLKTELHETTHNSVKKNIINVTVGFVDTLLYTGTIEAMSSILANNAIELITNPDFEFSDIDFNLDSLMDARVEMVMEKANMDFFEETITQTIDFAISEFDWIEIRDSIVDDAKNLGLNILTDIVTEKAAEVLSGAAGSVLEDLAIDIPMDLGNVAAKLASGNAKALLFDPVKIKIESPVVNLFGYVQYTENDSVWGNCFQAELNALIKKPVELQAFARFINGAKPVIDVSGMSDEEKKFVETYKYWLIEAGVQGFSIPMTPIPISLTGFEGKVYHHLQRQADRVSYLPSQNVRFGVGAGLYMVDAGSQGKVAMFDVGVELQLLQGGYEMSMDGNVFVANSEDGTSVVVANGFLQYNSVDKHFLANLDADVNVQSMLCISGGMIIDISKDWWQFAIGTRDDPVTVAMLCRIDMFEGWLDIDKVGVDLGLRAFIDFDVSSPWIDVSVVTFRGRAYFFFELGTELELAWRPFGVKKGLIYVNVAAAVGIEYETLAKSGSFDIASVALGGELEFATIPETYIAGMVYGRVSVLGFGAGMEMDASTTF